MRNAGVRRKLASIAELPWLWQLETAREHGAEPCSHHRCDRGYPDFDEVSPAHLKAAVDLIVVGPVGLFGGRFNLR
jgi:hypothetical protein